MVVWSHGLVMCGDGARKESKKELNLVHAFQYSNLFDKKKSRAGSDF